MHASLVWKRLVSSRDGKIGLCTIGALVGLSFALGPLLLADPNQSHFALPLAADGGPPGPSWRHLLGTDALLRDELSRLAAGGRISLTIGIAGATLAGLVGTSLGILSAALESSRAQALGSVIMRAADTLLALPFLLVITTLGVLVGRTSPANLVLLLGLSGWAGVARLVRTRALEVMQEDYVRAARALGAGPLQLGRRHVLPNVASTAIVLSTGLVGSMILAEAVLGYLTVGVAPPDATWGRMLHEGESMVSLRPLLSAAPGLMIVLAMLGFHRLGEGLSRALSLRPSAVERARAPIDLALAAGAVLLLVGLPSPRLVAPAQDSVGTDETPTRGGQLHLATFLAIRSLDPAIASDELSTGMGRMIFGDLLRFDESGTLGPGLAERFSWDEQGLALTLTLRAHVRFHDGSELSARDVKRSFERALSPRTASASANEFRDLVGFEAYRDGRAKQLDGITVLGERAVRFTLSRPNALLPSLLTLGIARVVCPSVPFEVEATPDSALCGAGPFALKSFESERGLELARHEGYFEPGLPYLDGITFSFYVRPQTQRYRFEHGELDLVRELSSADANLARADERWAPYGRLIDSLRVSAIFLNTEIAPFDNVHLRRAVAAGVDPTVLSKIRADLAPLSTVVPVATPGHRTPRRVRVYDRARALEEMRLAGYPFDPETGQGGYPEPIDYLTVPDTFEQAAAEVYAQQLGEIGLRVELRLVSFQTYLAEVQKRGRSRMGWTGWHADYPDALTFFDPKLSGAAIGEISQNSSFFANSELDQLLLRAKQTTDPTIRDAIFSRAEEIVAEEAPWVPTTAARVFELRQPYVRGYEPNALVALDFSRTWLVRGGPSRETAGRLREHAFGSAR